MLYVTTAIEVMCHMGLFAMRSELCDTNIETSVFIYRLVTLVPLPGTSSLRFK
jgi:hypothetical protein